MVLDAATIWTLGKVHLCKEFLQIGEEFMEAGRFIWQSCEDETCGSYMAS